MPAAYDTYDYPSYWEGRDYEHESEILAIKSFIQRIPKINNFLEIGSGYGRLSKTYLFRAKKAVLSDPSARLLSLARKRLGKSHVKNAKYLHINIENLPKKISKNSQDLVMMVRVLHHIKNIDTAFANINRVLANKGYLILEFANKSHFKATLEEFFKGNFTFPLDIFPKDIRSRKNLRIKTLPFINYHPYTIYQKLREHGFEIIESRSVSNLRHPMLKKYFPLESLLKLEVVLQKYLAKINFGPSVFVLCKKTLTKPIK